jgi:uncharacterized protein (DUF2141 family)
MVSLASLAFTANALADTAVTVAIAGIDAQTGKIYVSVFDSKKSWLKKPVVQEAISFDGAEATLELTLAPGEYAFQAFHDVDDNEKMKTNFIGIPKEPTAVSNDAKGKFGPPKFKDAVVTIGEEPVTVPLNLVSID